MTALQFALKKLARSSYYSARLLALLKEAGFEENECLEAIGYLEKSGFINDSDFVTYFVSKWKKQGKSRHEILAKAKHHSIPSARLAPYLADETEALEVLIRKRYPQLLQKDSSKKDKAIMALKRKGFSFYTILEIINKNKV